MFAPPSPINEENELTPPLVTSDPLITGDPKKPPQLLEFLELCKDMATGSSGLPTASRERFRIRSLNHRALYMWKCPTRRPVVREALPSTLLRDELQQSNQIVGGGSEGEGPPDATATAELRLLLPGHRLDPAERLFNALADALTDVIAAVPRRACVDRRTSAAGVLRAASLSSSA